MAIMKDGRGQFFAIEETEAGEHIFADTKNFSRVDNHEEETIEELHLGVE